MHTRLRGLTGFVGRFVLLTFWVSAHADVTGMCDSPATMIVDTGGSFGSLGGLSYGWDVDMRQAAYYRPEARSLPSYAHAAGIAIGPASTWEIAVTPGDYTVRVVAGDYKAASSDSYRVYVEDTLLIDARPTNYVKWIEATAGVRVSDGRITLRGSDDGVNNRICLVEICSRDGAVASQSPSPGRPNNGVTGGGGLRLLGSAEKLAMSGSSRLRTYDIRGRRMPTHRQRNKSTRPVGIVLVDTK